MSKQFWNAFAAALPNAGWAESARYGDERDDEEADTWAAYCAGGAPKYFNEGGW